MVRPGWFNRQEAGPGRTFLRVLTLALRTAQPASCP